MVIGETSRACNWSLYGYSRQTNPKLAQCEGLVAFPYALSESNTTHKSVPMLLSPVSAVDYDSLYYRKSIVTAFKEAGFHTAFFPIKGIIIHLLISSEWRLTSVNLSKKSRQYQDIIHRMLNY